MSTNETIKSILNRRSTRAFDNTKMISSEDLMLIAECGNAAPTGMNRQEWKFTAISNQEIIKKLAGEVIRILNRSEDYNFYGATALIIASGKTENVFTQQDCSCALENMFVAAESLNIGSVWINQLKDCLNDSGFRSLLREIGIPDDYSIVGSCALGYPLPSAAKTPTPKKNAINVIS